MIKSYLNDPERRKNEVIPGTFDPVFKSIFTTQKEYLADVVNYVTGIPREDIINKSVVRNSEHIIENIEEKKKTSDLVIEVNDKVINLEMNRSYYKTLNIRNNKYMYKLANMENERQIIQINFDNFNKTKKIINKYVMMEEETKEREEESVEKYKINLALINDKYYNKEKLSRFEKEMLMIVINKKEELKELSKGDRIMEELNKELNKLSDDKYLELLYDREERDKEMYESIMEERLDEEKIKIIKNMIDNNLDINTIIKSTGLEQFEIEYLFKEYKEDKYLELLHEKEGFGESYDKELAMKEMYIEEGMTQGLSQGITQGKKEEKIQIAKSMLKHGDDITYISEITGLSNEDIINLK